MQLTLEQQNLAKRIKENPDYIPGKASIIYKEDGYYPQGYGFKIFRSVFFVYPIAFGVSVAIAIFVGGASIILIIFALGVVMFLLNLVFFPFYPAFLTARWGVAGLVRKIKMRNYARVNIAATLSFLVASIVWLGLPFGLILTYVLDQTAKREGFLGMITQEAVIYYERTFVEVSLFLFVSFVISSVVGMLFVTPYAINNQWFVTEDDEYTSLVKNKKIAIENYPVIILSLLNWRTDVLSESIAQPIVTKNYVELQLHTTSRGSAGYAIVSISGNHKGRNINVDRALMLYLEAAQVKYIMELLKS